MFTKILHRPALAIVLAITGTDIGKAILDKIKIKITQIT